MKYFHIDGKIDEQLIDKFIVFINDNENQDWTFILNSTGGKESLTRVILDAINKRNRGVKTILISCGVYSSTFFLFYHAKCKKKIVSNSNGMIHLASAEMRMMTNKVPSFTEDECLYKMWTEEKGNGLEYLKAFMTVSELKKYKKGHDIYFTFKRMKEIFPDAEII